MEKLKIVSLSALSLLAIATLAACGNNKASEKNITFSIPTDVATLDPTIVTDQYSYNVIGNVEEGATRVDKNGDTALALSLIHISELTKQY